LVKQILAVMIMNMMMEVDSAVITPFH